MANLLRCLLTAAPLLIALAPTARAASELTVENLIKDGWEITGYASNFEGRSLILFKHKEKTHLVQCSVLYDVTRSNRVVTNCYDVR